MVFFSPSSLAGSLDSVCVLVGRVSSQHGRARDRKTVLGTFHPWGMDSRENVRKKDDLRGRVEGP